MDTQDFRLVTFLGTRERNEEVIEFLVSEASGDMVLCKVSMEDQPKKALLETLNIGASIRIQGDFREENIAHVSAFMV